MDERGKLKLKEQQRAIKMVVLNSLLNFILRFPEIFIFLNTANFNKSLSILLYVEIFK